MPDFIQEWFAQHDDGEFTISPCGSPYSVIPAASDCDCAIYCTKPQLMSERIDSDYERHFALVGRYGLPNDHDLASLHSFVGDRRLVFLGDADPADLLIFAWLRSRLDISFAGLNDSLLLQSGMQFDARMSIPLSQAEHDTMSVLGKALPDFVELVGSGCAATLESGRKLELEALFNCGSREPGDIFRAITM